MKRVIAALIALSISFTPLSIAAQTETLAQKAKNAVGILYSQEFNGGMTMRCTMTAFEKTKDGYLFASAAHCIGADNQSKERSAAHKDIPFYMTFDEAGNKTFYPAEPKAVGYQSRGDDFAIFEVKTDKTWPIIPIGTEKDEEEGNAIINVASPLGLGKQVFKGTISSLNLDRPIIQGDINWRGSIGLQIAAEGGSSGSAIISEKQEKIVAFLVGTAGGSTVIAIPATKFTAFKKAVEDGKYRWFKADDTEK